MKIDKYIKFILTLLTIWLFVIAVFYYSLATRKIEIGKENLNFQKWKSGYKESLRFLPDQKDFSGEKPYQVIETKSDRLIRFNKQTGKTEYWSIEGGGWVEIADTGLVTVISQEDRQKQKKIRGEITRLLERYPNLSEAVKKNPDYYWPILVSESDATTPSWQLQEILDKLSELLPAEQEE